MKIKFLIIILILAGLKAPRVFSCACCPEFGTYKNQTASIESYGIKDLTNYIFTGMWAMNGWHDVEGKFDGEKWSFSLKSVNEKNKIFSVSFNPADRFEIFMADMGIKSDAIGTVLYKEYRFSGHLESDDKFNLPSPKKAIKLIIQGRGGRCALNPSHFIFTYENENTGFAYGSVSGI